MNLKLIGLTGSVLAVAGAIAAIGTAGANPAPTWRHARSSTAAQAPAPATALTAARALPAFTRQAAATDVLPAQLVDALARLGQTATETRRVAVVDGTQVYVSLVNANGFGICLELLAADSVGYSTCNSSDGLAQGWLYLNTPTQLVGLADPTVSSIQTRQADGATTTVQPSQGVYAVPQTRTPATASLVHADGTLAGRVPIGPPPLSALAASG